MVSMSAFLYQHCGQMDKNSCKTGSFKLHYMLFWAGDSWLCFYNHIRAGWTGLGCVYSGTSRLFWPSSLSSLLAFVLSLSLRWVYAVSRSVSVYTTYKSPLFFLSFFCKSVPFPSLWHSQLPSSSLLSTHLFLLLSPLRLFTMSRVDVSSDIHRPALHGYR